MDLKRIELRSWSGCCPTSSNQVSETAADNAPAQLANSNQTALKGRTRS